MSLLEAPMSPQLSARCLLAVLAALLLASVLGLLVMGPVALNLPVVRERSWLQLLGPVLALAGALAGFGWAARLAANDVRRAWRAFFGAVAAAALFGLMSSAVSGAWPWWLGRVAVGSAGAVAALIFLGERLGRRWVAPRAVALALCAGPIAAGFGLVFQTLHGPPDERLLIWLEWAPLALVALGVWGLPSRGLGDLEWGVALGCFAVAKLVQLLDARGATDPLIDYRWLGPLAFAASVGWLAGAVRRQSLDSAMADEEPSPDRAGWAEAPIGSKAEPGPSASASASASPSKTSERTAA